MKILVIGLDGAVPELLLNDERLTNFRRLMDGGCYGRLESIILPNAVPAWMCMATSQDPGSLGVYGCRDRTDHSYGGLSMVNSRSIQETAVWDHMAREGKRAILLGVPPSYPPRQVHGVCVGCYLTPATSRDVYTYPAAVQHQISALVGEYPMDVKGFRTDRKDWLKNEVYAMSRKHFEVVRHFLQQFDWDYFQFVEIGLDRLQHGFWQFHDPQHGGYTPGNPYHDVIRDYYAYLDEQVGSILELLDDETVVLVASDHGAQRLDGDFCVNEWLVQEGLLVLNERPREVTPFGQLDVNWGKTKVWSEGGSCARVFFNVKGREPNGTIDKADYERLRDDLKVKFEAGVDDGGHPMGTLVFKPEEVYKTVRNIAPDLIVHFGGLRWRSVGGVGYPSIYARETAAAANGCNHAQFGSFILAAPNNPLHGEIAGAHLLDIVPTLLELSGYDIPKSMQGRSLVAGKALSGEADTGYTADEEELVRERLSGLGYIS
jgi:predicted AlkP superfamily phosphohydrolase/phosphomutase